MKSWILSLLGAYVNNVFVFSFCTFLNMNLIFSSMRKHVNIYTKKQYFWIFLFEILSFLLFVLG